MRTYIKKLQSKSEVARKQILVGSLVVCMTLVGVIWISSLGYKFNNEKTAKVEDDMKPFALFGQTISETYDNVTASVGNISTQKIEEKKNEKVIDLIPVDYQ